MASLTPKQQFMTKIGGVTTPSSVPQKLRSVVKKKAESIPPPRPKNNYQGPTKQSSDMQRAIELTNKVQKTYGVPGAK